MAKINSKIFKANDIRGKYPSEINEKIISEISRNLSFYFSQLAGQRSAKIVVAHDARLSSPGLYNSAITSLNGRNLKRLKIIQVGLSTTPMFYFLVKKSKAIGGIMITASHNPKNYNGLKIIDENALPISGWKIKKLFKL